jgi:hypothetical protein
VCLCIFVFVSPQEFLNEEDDCEGPEILTFTSTPLSASSCPSTSGVSDTTATTTTATAAPTAATTTTATTAGLVPLLRAVYVQETEVHHCCFPYAALPKTAAELMQHFAGSLVPPPVR